MVEQRGFIDFQILQDNKRLLEASLANLDLETLLVVYDRIKEVSGPCIAERRIERFLTWAIDKGLPVFFDEQGNATELCGNIYETDQETE